MNIIEAIKSGKLIKRKGWGEWYDSYGIYIEYTAEDILSEDWEIKEDIEKKLIDRNKSYSVKIDIEISDNDNSDSAFLTSFIYELNKIEEFSKEKAHKFLSDCCCIFYEHMENIKNEYDNGTISSNDLINVPEPEEKKPIDIHYGGIYKAINGSIWICIKSRFSNEKYMYCLQEYKAYPSRNFDYLIEHLGDVQNLHEYIKQEIK